jgi:hypothetical protein
MEKIIEINLGVGLNQLFPEPVKIIIENDTEEVYLKNGEDNNKSNND